MSEYQYYEFAAVDRPLDDEQMAALRAVSTRGRVTRTSFTNHYEWGGLKADPIDWVRRYFDAFVYTANWASCQLPADAEAAIGRHQSGGPEAIPSRCLPVHGPPMMGISSSTGCSTTATTMTDSPRTMAEAGWPACCRCEPSC